MTMSTLRYLAYGSNLSPGRLQRRIGDFEICGQVALSGWRLGFDKRGRDGSGKCTLHEDPQGQAWGVVYEMPAAARATLDRIEGVGAGYRVAWLPLEGFGRCYVYLAEADALDNRLVPYDWYLALVAHGAALHELPSAYQATLADVAVVPDPDRTRAAQNLADREWSAPAS